MGANSNAIETVLKLDATKFKLGLGDAQKQVLSFTGSITAFGAAALAAAKLTANYQDETIKLSRAVGSSAEQFSAMRHAADMSGVSIDDLKASYTVLNQASDTTAKTLARIGVSMKTTTGQLKTADQLFSDISDKMSKMPSASDRATLAVTLFGESGGKLVNILQGGKQGLADFKKEAEDLGIVVSTKAAIAAEKFNDDSARLSKSIQGLSNSVSTSIIEFLNQGGVLDSIRSSIQELTKWWNNLDADTKKTIVTIGAITVAIGALTTAITLLVPAIIAAKAALGTGIMATLGPIAILTAVVVGLATLWVMHWNQMRDAVAPVMDAFLEMKQSINDDIISPIKELFSTIGDKFKKAGEDVAGVSTEFSILGAVAKTALKILSTGVVLSMIPLQVMVKVVSSVVAAIRHLGEAAFDLLKRNWSGAAANAKKAGDSITDGFVDVVDVVLGAKDRIDRIWATPTKVKIETDTSKLRSDLNNLPKKLDFKEPFKPFQNELTQAITQLQAVDKAFADGTANARDFGKAVADVMAASANIAKSFSGGILELSEVIASRINYASKIALRDLDVLAAKQKEFFDARKEEISNSEDENIESIEDSYNDQIDQVKRGEKRKNDAIKWAINERKLLLNQEYLDAIARAEAEFAAKMEQDRIIFEAEKELLLEKSIDKEQRMINEEFLEADWRKYKEEQKRLHEQNLSNIQKEFNDKEKLAEDTVKANESAALIAYNAANIQEEQKHDSELERIEKEKNAALEAARKSKDDKLKSLDAQRIESEKAIEKQRLQIQYQAEVATFEQTKKARVADTWIAGIAAAAQAFSALAPIPFVGQAMGAAAAVLILKKTNEAVKNIQSQQPIKPAGLMMEQGGFLGGNQSHARGGINANLESNEFVIDKYRTQKIQDAIDSGLTGGGLTINFSAGSIVGSNMTSEDAARKISEIVARNLRRQGVVS